MGAVDLVFDHYIVSLLTLQHSQYWLIKLSSALFASIARMYYTIKLVTMNDTAFVYAQLGLWTSVLSTEF